MAVVECAVRVANRLGIHARPAAELVKIATGFAATIQFAKDGEWVNGKSIMGVMTLAAEQGSEVTIRADGEDAQAAVDALAACVAKEWEEW